MPASSSGVATWRVRPRRQGSRRSIASCLTPEWVAHSGGYGADEADLVRVVARQAPARQGAMWEGLGTALAYAGGVSPAAMRRLRDAAGAYRADLRVGVGLAAFMRRRGGNAAEWTEQACHAVLGLSEDDAAAVVGRVRSEVLALPDMADPGVCRSTCYLAMRTRLRTEWIHD